MKRLLAQIHEADAVLIFGPGEAKRELEKRIAHQKVKVSVVGIETVDKLTERQIAAIVRKYFQEAVES